MEEQQEIMERFYKLYGKVTLDKVSKLTGIQKTRVFRLLNGSEMKLSEYLSFKGLIDKKSGRSVSLKEVTEECLLKLNEEVLVELTELCERKLYFTRLKEVQSTAIVNEVSI